MYRDLTCPKCGHKLATDMMGREWCPKCVGKKMAQDVIKKVKFPEFEPKAVR